MGNKRQLSCHWPTGFCSGHKVLVTETILKAGLDNPTELRSCLKVVHQSPLSWPLHSRAKWEKRKGLGATGILEDSAPSPPPCPLGKDQAGS